MEVEVPLQRPYVLARGEVTSYRNLILRLHSEDGIVGLGECAVLSVSGDRLEARRVLRQIVHDVLGRDSLEHEDIIRRTGPTLQSDLGPVAALDMALWDLNAKSCELPAYSVMGGLVHHSILVDFTLGQDAPGEMARRAEEMAELGGFTGFCVKVGGSGQVEEDVARVKAVRDAVGPSVRVRVDANGGYGVDAARRFIQAIAPMSIEFIEQPLAADDVAGLEHLRGSPVPVCIDEGLRTVAAAYRLANTGVVSIFNIKIPKCGGILLSKKIAAVGEAAGIPVICGGGLVLEITRQASRHFVASTPAISEGLHHEGPGPASQGLVGNVTQRVIEYDDIRRDSGRVELLSDDVGLGIQEDAQAVATFATGPREVIG